MKVKTCGTGFSGLVNICESGMHIQRAVWKCGSRFCPTCARERRNQILQKMQYFSHVKHCIKLELTFPESSPSAVENPKYYSAAWELFLKRVKRKYKEIKFFRIVELTKKGVPHFHIILDKFISHTWISDNFPECGGGYVNWIKIVDPGRAFKYVTKYVTKNAADPEDYIARFFFFSGMRQFSSSRHIYYRAKRDKTKYFLYSEAKNLIVRDDFREYKHRERYYVVIRNPEGKPMIYLEPSEEDPFIQEFQTYDYKSLIESLYKRRFFEPEPGNKLPVLYF